MAKSDLLKQAIADAKAVKETALANAKLALQEAFAPRLENMLQSKLIGEIDGEEDADVDMDLDTDVDMNADAPIEDEMGGEEDFQWTDDTLAANVDGQDYSFQVGMAGEDEDEMGDEMMGDETGMEDEMTPEAPAEDDLNLEEILRELEMPADEEDDYSADASVTEGEDYESNEDEDEEDINEIIEAILRETDMGIEAPTGSEEDITALKTENEELEKNLEEAYRTVKHLNSVINEVNLLNAKLLYTNKLFRNFDLNEGQKMKVIENFDRAVSPREAKLVFATLAESFTKPTQKRAMVKESAASRPTRTTAPSKETTQILSEGFEMANRWKKLAGLI